MFALATQTGEQVTWCVITWQHVILFGLTHAAGLTRNKYAVHECIPVPIPR